ncbi:MAG: hypothetical protein V2J26_04240 [Pacificimonas sp.]|jgi:hypothetical protein|nr:hypothetical protein [Pacificimonas sp.]
MTSDLRFLGAAAVALAALISMYVSETVVAAEREAIRNLHGAISEDERAVADLASELGVRSSLSRLEEMNDKHWSLASPKVGQMVAGDAELAALLSPRDEGPEIVLASYDHARPVAVAEIAEEPGLINASAADALDYPRDDSGVVVLAPADMPKAAPAQPAADELFSASFLVGIDAAVSLERASFRSGGR